VIAVDEMNQRQNLRNFLAEEEVMQLRQTNDELDAKLRQVDDCLATSPQPMHDLLPLMTELVQLKVQEVKSVQSAPSVAPVEQATVSSTPQVAHPKVKEPKTPVLGRGAKKLIFAFVLFLLLIPLGFYGYWLWRAFVLERDVAIALDATPELSLYRLDPEVKGNTLYLTGKLPSQSLSDRAADVAQGTVPTLALENHIVVVEALLDPAQKQTEIDKVLNPLNGINGIQIKSELAGDRLTLKGTVLRQDDIDVIIAAVENISGISQVINKIQVEAQPISIQLYFDQNSAAIKPDDLTNKLERVKTFLQQHPDLNLRITGYQHPSESASDVALKRAQTTQILLQDQGIDRRRIVTLGVNQSPPNITPSEPIWLSRTVLFDVVPPTAPR
jgi:outer membrane protein OmpA-like peptidoglycan-associated protein